MCLWIFSFIHTNRFSAQMNWVHLDWSGCIRRLFSFEHLPHYWCTVHYRMGETEQLLNWHMSKNRWANCSSQDWDVYLNLKEKEHSFDDTNVHGLDREDRLFDSRAGPSPSGLMTRHSHMKNCPFEEIQICSLKRTGKILLEPPHPGHHLLLLHPCKIYELCALKPADIPIASSLLPLTPSDILHNVANFHIF